MSLRRTVPAAVPSVDQMLGPVIGICQIYIFYEHSAGGGAVGLPQLIAMGGIVRDVNEGICQVDGHGSEIRFDVMIAYKNSSSLSPVAFPQAPAARAGGGEK